MSHHSLARALLLVVVGLLVWTTVSPAEAKRPRRYSDEFLLDWTVCKNGGEFTISAGAGVPRTTPVRVRLVVTSATRGRVLADVRVRLRYHPHTIYVFNDVPAVGVPVIPNPEIDPRADEEPGNEVEPQAPEREAPSVRNWVRTVKVFWRWPAGALVNIGLGPADQARPTFATYFVEDCLLLSDKRHGSFAALRFWLQDLTRFA